MKLLSALAMLASALLVPAQDIPPIIPPDLVTEYKKLFNICINSSNPNDYVAVRYQNNNYVTFAYNECYPYEINGNKAEMAVFCRSVTCYNNPNPDCTGGAVPPVGVPLLKGLTLYNEADFTQYIGQGATCQKNGLSNI